MVHKKLALVAGVVVGSITATMGQAQAATVFTDQSAFLAQVQSGSYLETFDSLPLGFISSPLSFSQGGFSYSASTADDFFNVGTVSDVWLSVQNSLEPIVFNFTSGNVTAVGGFFFPTELFGDLTPGTVTVALNDGTSEVLVDPDTTSFLGFTSNSPITSLTVTASSTGSDLAFSTVNDFIVGQVATPVPESDYVFPLLGLGLIGLSATFNLSLKKRIYLAQKSANSQRLLTSPNFTISD